MAEQVLQVSQWWGEELLDVRTFGADHPRVSIGLRSAVRWRFLGVDMGCVPAAAAPLLAAVTPGWSEVRRERRADFAVPDPGDPAEDADWDLVVRRGDRLVARVPAGWTADRGGAAGDDGEVEVELGEDEVVAIERAPFRFEVRSAARTERVESRFVVDPGFLGAAASVVLLLATVGLGTLLAPTARAVSAQVDTDELIEVLLQAPPPPTLPDRGAASGEKAKGKEGARPKQDKPEPRKAGKRSDKEVATSSGLLGTPDIDALLGGAELPTDLRLGVGGLIGNLGSGIGSNGLGNRGSGIGGGGEAEGIGGLGPTGGGPGGGGLYESGSTKQEGRIGVPDGEAILVGNLDRAEIDEVVKRQLTAIRYCYQRELQRDPELAGKVTVKFTIARDGTVSKSDAGGSLDNDMVRSCIRGRFLTMKFPEPRGGGIVVVSYPFLFSPG